MFLTTKLPDQIDNERNYNAENNAGDDRKIESKIFFFDQNITRQPANPGDFISKLHNNSNQHEYQTDDDDKFSHIFDKKRIYSKWLNMKKTKGVYI